MASPLTRATTRKPWPGAALAAVPWAVGLWADAAAGSSMIEDDESAGDWREHFTDGV